ncbi:MAG TPA: hypothetical protein VF552_15410 [Allosphingosinicella sp.]|jgi:hypothetical protein
MRTRFLLLFAASVAFGAIRADACRIYIPAADLSALHRTLPHPLPADLFVAEVQFERPDAGWNELREGTRARIERVIQGAYSGDMLIVRDSGAVRVTCYAPLRYGGAGIILGRPVGYENGQMVLEPVFEGPRQRR